MASQRASASVLLQIICFHTGRGLGLTYIGAHVCLSSGCLIEAAQANVQLGKDPEDYLRSIAEKEIESTRRYGKPLELDFPHNGPFPGKHDPKQYIALLEKYLALVPYLLPKDDSDPLNQPTLRHPGMLKFFIALPTFVSCSFLL